MKEYLLLRNNKQSGPYSLDDLKQLGLKAFDLIWVDKRSSAWRYPSEVKELIAFVDNIHTNVTDNVDQKLVSLINTTALSKTGFDNATTYNFPVAVEVSEQHVSHVVALKPALNNTSIRTIKSHSSRNNIVQVQVRTDEALAANVSSIEETKTQANNAGHIITPEHNTILELSSRSNHQATAVWENTAVYSSKNQYISDNKLELAVLVIGAISLLAIVFLLITSPY